MQVRTAIPEHCAQSRVLPRRICDTAAALLFPLTAPFQPQRQQAFLCQQLYLRNVALDFQCSQALHQEQHGAWLPQQLLPPCQTLKPPHACLLARILAAWQCATVKATRVWKRHSQEQHLPQSLKHLRRNRLSHELLGMEPSQCSTFAPTLRGSHKNPQLNTSMANDQIFISKKHSRGAPNQVGLLRRKGKKDTRP